MAYRMHGYVIFVVSAFGLYPYFFLNSLFVHVNTLQTQTPTPDQTDNIFKWWRKTHSAYNRWLLYDKLICICTNMWIIFHFCLQQLPTDFEHFVGILIESVVRNSIIIDLNKGVFGLILITPKHWLNISFSHALVDSYLT